MKQLVILSLCCLGPAMLLAQDDGLKKTQQDHTRAQRVFEAGQSREQQALALQNSEIDKEKLRSTITQLELKNSQQQKELSSAEGASKRAVEKLEKKTEEYESSYNSQHAKLVEQTTVNVALRQKVLAYQQRDWEAAREKRTALHVVGGISIALGVLSIPASFILWAVMGWPVLGALGIAAAGVILAAVLGPILLASAENAQEDMNDIELAANKNKKEFPNSDYVENGYGALISRPMP